MALAPAFRLGPYEIVELLSAGGMGEVYRARDTRLGRQVAVKVLPRAFAIDPERLSRFEREAQAAAALNHPNIVAIFDVGTHDDVSFVVSELIDGVTLRASLQDARLRQATSLRYAAEIARGLSAAHAVGIVHRDLKPENVMITRDERVKIVDFGIAKRHALADGAPLATGRATLPGTILGTIAYMSPEQVRAEEVDHRTDIFSLGVVLYEMLAGRHPFIRSNGAETISAILRDDPPPLTGLGETLDAIVRRALAKSRDSRFQSALELALALDAAAGEPRPGARDAASPPHPRAIAVLPFTNMSPDADSEYFSDGLTEELIHALTGVRGLQVVAWHSAAQMKGHQGDPRAIGRELHVESVLVGSVRKAGDRVRIGARLVDVEGGHYLWSETYDRQIQDLFAIQEEIAGAIVGTLTRSLAQRLVPARPARRSASLEAYNLYLRGRFFWNKRTAEGLQRGIECFEAAVAADEHFALAHAGLADAYCLLVDYGLAAPDPALPRARAAAIRALELDPRSAEAHASFALIRSLYDWEWLEAEALYRRAIELNRGYATAHHWLAIDLLATLGRFDEAEEEVEIARQLDPLSLIIQEGRAYLMMLARRYDEAVDAYQGLIELDPTFYKAYTSLGRVYSLSGDYEQATRMLQRGRDLAGDIPSILGALGQTRGLAGDRGAARRLLAELEAMATTRHVPATSFALIHAGLGEVDDALAWLERGCDRRDLSMSGLKTHPAYDRLRGEPRFDAVLARMNLTEP